MKSRSNESAASGDAIESVTTVPTRLLVSVRSEQEIDDAIAGGADIVDLKEPRDGALAPTTIELWNSVSQWTDQASVSLPAASQTQSIRFSAALGESEQAISIAASLSPAFAFAKVGPSNCDTPQRLTELWATVFGQLNGVTELVAVAYADHESAGCLPAEQVFKLAAEFGFQRCLIDTFRKDGRTTVDHLGINGLTHLASVAQQRQLWWALAGSIRLDQVERFRRESIWPNCFGVRGDVCGGDRQGVLSTMRVMQWKDACTIQPNCTTETDCTTRPDRVAWPDRVTRPNRVPSGS